MNKNHKMRRQISELQFYFIHLCHCILLCNIYWSSSHLCGKALHKVHTRGFYAFDGLQMILFLNIWILEIIKYQLYSGLIRLDLDPKSMVKQLNKILGIKKYFSVKLSILLLLEMEIGPLRTERGHPFWKRSRSIRAKNPPKVSNNFTVAFTILRGSAYQRLLLIESI